MRHGSSSATYVTASRSPALAPLWPPNVVFGAPSWHALRDRCSRTAMADRVPAPATELSHIAHLGPLGRRGHDPDDRALVHTACRLSRSPRTRRWRQGARTYRACGIEKAQPASGPAQRGDEISLRSASTRRDHTDVPMSRLMPVEPVWPFGRRRADLVESWWLKASPVVRAPGST